MAEFTIEELFQLEPAKDRAEALEAAKKYRALPKCDGLAFWVPPCTDVFIGRTAYVWYRLLPGGLHGSLEGERFSNDTLGEAPAWLEEYDDVWYELASGYNHNAAALFALENGLSPGQPFLLQLGEPRWYKSSYEYDEYDVEYDVEIVRALPRDPLKAIQSLEREWAYVWNIPIIGG